MSIKLEWSVLVSDKLVELLIRLHLAHISGKIDTVIYFIFLAGKIEVELTYALYLLVNIFLRANFP